MPRTALHAALGATLLIAAPVAAQVGTAPPNSYALTNARIVTAPGRTIERGTVVIRNGRITAVGAQVTVPGDVQSMDLAGLTVYPGLIDPASALGMPRTSANAGRGRGAAPPGPPTQAATARLASNRTEIPEIQPTRLASETVQLQEADVQALRALGFTTVGLAFEPAIIGGQTAVVSLRTTNLDSALLRSPAALQIGLETRRGAYPTTLMGTLAYLEQAFLDAAHQQRVVEAFERDPARGPRPVHDADRSALLPAVQRKIPVFITASRENDLRRAAALARRMNVDYVLLGAQEAYRATDLLTKENKPVIVSLNYPRPDAVTGRAFELHVAPVSGTDSAKLRADSAIARTLRGNPAALVKAGVPFALTTFGLDRVADFRGRVRSAIDAGLTADDALRALTITPARILGLERMAGTIEAGKLANLVVTQGDLFAADARVRHVFVEGQHFSVRETERLQGRSGRSGQPGGSYER